MRIWDTFVVDTNNFAQAVAVRRRQRHRGRRGGASAALFNSRFAREAFEHAYRQGVFFAIVSSDLNTADHNIPTLYDEAMQVQGTVADVQGLGEEPASQEFVDFFDDLGIPLGTNAPIGTWFRNSGTTQYGGHAHIVMPAVTGSPRPARRRARAGLVKSFARQEGMRARAERDQAADHDDGGGRGAENTVGLGVPDPAQPGWDQHFGYGLPDLGLALERIDEGKIPPQALITSPEWFEPLNVNQQEIVDDRRARALADARGRLHLPAPVGARHRAGRGGLPRGRTCRRETSAYDGSLGTIDLDAVRADARRAPSGGATVRPDRARQGPRRQGPERARVHRARGGHRHRGQPRRGPQDAVRLPRPDAARGLVEGPRHRRRGVPAAVRPRRGQRARHRAGRLERGAAGAQRRRHAAVELQQRAAGAYAPVPERAPRRAQSYGIGATRRARCCARPRSATSTATWSPRSWTRPASTCTPGRPTARSWRASRCGSTRRSRAPRTARATTTSSAASSPRPTLGDLNEDGDLEIVDPGARPAPLRVGRAAATRCRASRRSCRTRRSPAREIITTAALGDMSGDGKLDIVTPTAEFDDNPSAPQTPGSRRGRRLLATSSRTSSPTCWAAAAACTRSTATATCCRAGRPRPTGSCRTRCRSSARAWTTSSRNVDADPELEAIGNVASGDVTATNGNGSQRRAVRLRAGGRRARGQVEGAQPVREPDRREHRRRRRARGDQGRRDAQPAREPRRRGRPEPALQPRRAGLERARPARRCRPSRRRSRTSSCCPARWSRTSPTRPATRSSSAPGSTTCATSTWPASRAPAGRSSPAAGSSPRRRGRRRRRRRPRGA